MSENKRYNQAVDDIDITGMPVGGDTPPGLFQLISQSLDDTGRLPATWDPRPAGTPGQPGRPPGTDDGLTVFHTTNDEPPGR